jgi:hypothetical protein
MMGQNLLHCGIQRRRFFCCVGNNERKTPLLFYRTEEFFKKHPEIIPCYILQWRKTSTVSHNGGKPLPLYPTTDEKPLHFISKCKKCCCHNGKKTKTLITTQTFSAK